MYIDFPNNLDLKTNVWDKEIGMFIYKFDLIFDIILKYPDFFDLSNVKSFAFHWVWPNQYKIECLFIKYKWFKELVDLDLTCTLHVDLKCIAKGAPNLIRLNLDRYDLRERMFPLIKFKDPLSGEVDISNTYLGFIAEQVRQVYPHAVTGISGEEIDGIPQYQQMDMSKLIPIIVGAIKELAIKIGA